MAARRALHSADDLHLLHDARAGDREAFERLIQPQLDSLYRFAARELDAHQRLGDLGPGEVEPADLVNDAVLLAMLHLNHMPEGATLRGWLRHLVLKQVDREVRRGRRERGLQPPSGEGETPDGRPFWAYFLPAYASSDEPPPPPPLEAEATEAASLADEYERIVHLLPGLERRVFTLVAIERVPLGEVARIFGQGPDEIRRLYRGAREHLRQLLFGERTRVR